MATNVRAKVSDCFASVTNGFTVTVTEVNVAPIFTAIAPKAVNELALLSVVLSAKDSDLPAQVLTYGLVSEPTNMTVSEVGTVVWTPTEAQGPSTNTVRVKVSDGVASVTNAFTVTVAEVNVAPIFTAIASKAVNELALLLLILSANPAIPCLEVQGGDAKGNQGDVLAIQFGHVTKRGAVKRASAKVVVALEPAVELLALMGIDQTDRDSLEKIRFGGQIGATHRKS